MFTQYQGVYAYECSENIISGIELMVSNCHGIETKLIEGVCNFLAPVETVEQSTLQSKYKLFGAIDRIGDCANLEFVPSV